MSVLQEIDQKRLMSINLLSERVPHTSIRSDTAMKLLIALLIVIGTVTVSHASAMRAVTVKDLLDTSQFGGRTMSSDGRWLAYDIIQPISAYNKPIAPLLSRKMIFRSAHVFNVSNGQNSEIKVDGKNSTWIGPWSPDDRRLVVFSANTSTGDFEIGVYDPISDKYQKLPGIPSRPLPSGVNIGTLQQVAWIDENTLVYPTVEEGRLPLYLTHRQGFDQTTELSKIYTDKKTTSVGAIAYDATPHGYVPAVTKETLVRVNIASRRQDAIFTGRIWGFIFSPTRDYAVVMKNSNRVVLPPRERRLGTGQHGGYLFNSAVLLSLRDQLPPVEIAEGRGVHYTLPVTWSPDGKLVSFYGHAAGEPWETSVPHVYDVVRRQTTRLFVDDLDLIMPRDGTTRGETARPVFFVDRVPYVIANQAAARAQRDVTFGSSAAFYGSEGKIWQLSSLQPPAEANVAPLRSIAFNHSSLMNKPNPNNVKVVEENRGGITKLVLKNGFRYKEIMTINGHLSDVRHPTVRKIKFINKGDGKEYLAWYVLPATYVKGKKYPVVVEIYPGLVHSDNRAFKLTSELAGFNPRLAAEMGYVTLYASAPIDVRARPFDLPKQMADSVDSAVDALIKEGIADQDRLAIYGASAGAYAAVSVATQTSRFKAIIAAAGIYNLSSFYGTFLQGRILDPAVHFEFFAPSYLEGGLGSLGVAPWRDPELYVRNSPIFSIDRIKTPILLLHGQADYVPIQQAEELFTGMTRENREARFVRYLGEGHWPERPETQMHQWLEIERWLRKYV